MKPRVYLETTIPSYLTAWPSRDIVQAGQQQQTRDWWAGRDRFDLFASQLVIAECQAGDPEAARARLAALTDIDLLPLEPGESAIALGETLLREVPLPERAATDALHIAVAAIHGMDYLLTWNCKHIANPQLIGKIGAICERLGYRVPLLCTPQNFPSEEVRDD